MGCCNVNTKGNNTKDVSLEFACPRCEEAGTIVGLITPQSLLTENRKISLRSDYTYKYCKNQNCSVAYFTADKEHIFFTQDLKEKATLKDKGMDVKVCYCFGHTRQSVLSELQNTGHSSVLDDIKSKMKDPGCFCETSNPQGACCLGNVSSWIKEATPKNTNKKIDL